SPVNVTGNRAGSRLPPTLGGGPQWSPVNVTGNSAQVAALVREHNEPQWSPVNVTGNRPLKNPTILSHVVVPQWSPVNVTGNRSPRPCFISAVPGDGARC